MRHLLSFLFIGTLLFIYSCDTTSTRVSNQNISQVYKKDQSILHPEYAVYHVSDNISQLHFRLHSFELLYARPDGDTKEYSCNVRVSYQLKTSYEAKEVIDTGSVKIVDSYVDVTDKDIVGELDVKALAPNTYLLQVTVIDMKRRTENVSYIEVNKSNNLSRQNFLLLNLNGIPKMKNTLRSNEHFRLKNRNGATKYYVRYYKRDFPLPAPPFSIYNPRLFDYAADSLFTMNVNENDSSGFILPQKGFYHFQTDTTSKDGLTIYRTDDAFPYVRSMEYLMSPLRYVTSKNEFEKLNVYSNKKMAVDSFWVSCAGSAERAKELIKKYYNRVQDANLYFSSYIDGWKSDRGLIYVIYGPPNVLYRSTNSETWVYGEETNINSITFSFTKTNNPFSDNDFRIERNPSYKDSWYRAVDSWRQGRVFIDN